MSATQERFQSAVIELSARVESAGIDVEDDHTDLEVRLWLDGDESPLSWASSKITADEWFFITTLYGTMTLEGQRTHIRKFFPMFIDVVQRDVRNFTPEILEDWKLRQPWMKRRLCKMAAVLKEQDLAMEEYAESLRNIEKQATPSNPMPSLAKIMRDHEAGEGKTLSVFIRDCVKGNCFPIDSRVMSKLIEFDLPQNERDLVSLCLGCKLNPRRTARIFYQAP